MFEQRSQSEGLWEEQAARGGACSWTSSDGVGDARVVQLVVLGDKGYVGNSKNLYTRRSYSCYVVLPHKGKHRLCGLLPASGPGHERTRKRWNVEWCMKHKWSTQWRRIDFCFFQAFLLGKCSVETLQWFSPGHCFKGEAQAHLISLPSALKMQASKVSHSAFRPGANSFLAPQSDSDGERASAGGLLSRHKLRFTVISQFKTKLRPRLEKTS